MAERRNFLKLARRAALAALLVWLPAAFAASPEVLRPEQAFRYQVSAGDDAVRVLWDIEPGYYLYRGRMSYGSASPGVSLGAAVLPPGKPYYDEFFGDIEIYRGSAEVVIPVVATGGAGAFNLAIRSQGCADVGVCYPPQLWTANVVLAGTAAAPAGGRPAALPVAAATGTSASEVLRRALSAGPAPGADSPLPPEDAFYPAVELSDDFTATVRFAVTDGYYVYRDSLAFRAESGPARVAAARIPPGTAHRDEHFGDTRVFFSDFEVVLPLSRATPAGGLMELAIDYQGCKQDSICYPPQTLLAALDLPPASAGSVPPPAATGAPMVSEQDRLAALIGGGNLLLVMATFAGLGLLLAFTPCVLPMVPILSGIIAGQGRDVTTGRAFSLSLVYVLGMAVTYTAAGALFAAAGTQIQAALQKPWIISAVAALFVALALSMFGLFELRMPAALTNRIAAASGRQGAGTWIGTAVMGALSALVVTTCVAPPLVATLAVMAQTADVTRGALALFALAIGMGIPLLVVGTSAGRWLPKAGAWMERVKALFGVMLLGLAVWMLERILPGALTLALWAVVMVMAGAFLGAFTPLAADAGNGRLAAKGLGVLAALYGAVLLVGALAGNHNPLRPLELGGGQAPRAALEFRTIKTVADLEREVAAAAGSGRPVMLDFYADWCVSCKEMEYYTFTDPAVQAALAGTVLLKADVTANDAADQALLQHFGIYGPPTIVFYAPDGREQPDYRVVGYMPAGDFITHLAGALGAARGG